MPIPNNSRTPPLHTATYLSHKNIRYSKLTALVRKTKGLKRLVKYINPVTELPCIQFKNREAHVFKK